ncbi:predicted protein [Chaetoceros tenuissimus]|uniref:Uncharacterized protein n=1 Tax=Chaetoceros tenuissimus TaxID=426638 RepID=A0AAD3CS17_9STRA|nr:predicted protein [Chaetoceros tenuissimus]
MKFVHQKTKVRQGDSNGETLGRIVGNGLGIGEGGLEGVTVGVAVGNCDGEILGRIVGNGLGIGEGGLEGETLGRIVGNGLGIGEGGLEGETVGVAVGSLESRAIETYFSKKAAKSNELKSTIQSKEFKKPPSKKKPSRKRNAFEVSPPKVIRFLDQTASIGEDTYVYIAVDETTDTKFKHVLDKFALAKVEQFSLKYNYDVDGTVYLEKIRHRDADGRFVRFCTDNTWAHCLSEQDIDLEKWDFTNDQIIARWHDSSILIAPRPRV